MEFRLLGAVEVVDGDRTLPLGGPKPRALLAHLVVEAGRAVPRELLVDDLWGDDPPATVQDSLNVHLGGLRRVLGSRLHTERHGYRLDAAPDEVDAMRFEAAVAAARQLGHDPSAMATALRGALALWRGPVFGGIPVGRTAAAAAARLEEARLCVIEDRVEADLALGGHAELVAELTGLSVANPGRERLTGQLMLALHRCGRSADALEVYAAICRDLDDQLGVDPGEALVALSKAIYRGDPTLTVSRGASLPTSASRFVGRGMEIAAAGTLLATCRLLTLSGPGGSGKSRLAIELARAAAAGHPDGVWMIDLAPLTPSASLSREVAATLGVRERPGQPLPALLAAWLQHRRCLLVLDNCEHLVGACADLASLLLEAAPGLRVLATSREPLAISGEVVFAVAGLSLSRAGDPDEAIEAADAVRLLLDRAAAARPGFTLRPGDAARAAAVCARLDGLPLAIELAAARLRNISLRELASWLEEHLDGLSGSRAVHARHRTMRAAIEWSHDLLDDSEQAVFRRLSVFAGGLDADAARAAVEGWEPIPGNIDILELCDRLANKSMVLAEPGPERTRYRMLEVVRQFAAGRLVEAGEEASARSRHAAWYRQLIPDARTWSGSEQAMWVGRLGREVANVRAALGWYLGDGWQPFLALDMVGRLWWFWYMRGLLGEGRGWFRRALAATPAEPSAERALALRGAAATARVMGDFIEATQLGLESLDVCRALGDDRGVAASLNTLCISAMVRADLTAARRYGEESLEVAERLGDARGLANSRNSLGIVARNLGQLDRASELFASARDLYDANGNGRGVAAALSNLAILARRTGDLERARELSLEALHLYTVLDFDEGRLDCLEMLGVLEADAGRPERALRVLTVVARRLEELAAPLFVPDEVQQFADATAMARAALGPAEVERVQLESQQMTIDDVVAELQRPATVAADIR